MIKVLFVCVHNSARSQMGEAFLNELGKDIFFAESAGLEPGKLNPNVVLAMKEVGIDISQNQTKSTDDMLNLGRSYEYVITVCDEASGQRCPIFPGVVQNYHWDLPDPSAIKGTQEEILASIRPIRDEIKRRVEKLITDIIEGV